MIKVLIAGLSLLLCASAQAQTGSAKSKAALDTEISVFFPDNTVGQATPFNTRQTLLDIVQSYLDAATANPTFSTVAVAPPVGSLAAGLTVTQAASGSASTAQSYNLIDITADNASITGSNFGIGLNVALIAGGSSTQGGREAIQGFVSLTNPTNGGNTNRNYVGIEGICAATSGDGGTNTGAGARGACFGGSWWSDAQAGATNLLGVGSEIDVSCRTGCTTKYKPALGIVEHALDQVHGATLDAGLALSGQAGAIGLNTGITFSDYAGQHMVISTGTLINSTGGTFAAGLDFSASTLTTSIKLPSFSILGTGNTNIGPNSIGDGIPLSIVNQANAALVTSVGSASTNQMHVAGADGAQNQSVFDSFGGSNTVLGRRVDGTAASRTGLVANDVIWSLSGQGWTSAAAYSPAAAAVQLVATETYSGTANGASVRMRTTKNTTTAIADAMIVDGLGHLQVGSIAPTSVSTCGTGSIAANSTDAGGQVTATGATACTLNFGNNYTSIPNCVVTDNTTAAALKAAVSTSAVVVTGLTSNDVFTYVCTAKVGG